MKNILVLGAEGSGGNRLIDILMLNFLEDHRREELIRSFSNSGNSSIFKLLGKELKKKYGGIWPSIGSTVMKPQYRDILTKNNDSKGIRCIRISSTESLAEFFSLTNIRRRYFVVPHAAIIVMPFEEANHIKPGSYNRYYDEVLDMVDLCRLFSLTRFLIIVTQIGNSTQNQINVTLDNLKDRVEHETRTSIPDVYGTEVGKRPFDHDTVNSAIAGIKVSAETKGATINKICEILLSIKQDSIRSYSNRFLVQEFFTKTDQSELFFKGFFPPNVKPDSQKNKSWVIAPFGVRGKMLELKQLKQRDTVVEPDDITKNYMMILSSDAANLSKSNTSPLPFHDNGGMIIHPESDAVLSASEIIAEVHIPRKERFIAKGSVCILESSTSKRKALCTYVNEQIFTAVDTNTHLRMNKALVRFRLLDDDSRLLCDLYERDAYLGTFLLKTIEGNFLGAGKIRFVPSSDIRLGCGHKDIHCTDMIDDASLSESCDKESKRDEANEAGWVRLQSALEGTHISRTGITPHCYFHDKVKRVRRSIEIAQVLISLGRRNAFHPSLFLRLMGQNFEEDLIKGMLFQLNRILEDGYCRKNWLSGLKETFTHSMPDGAKLGNKRSTLFFVLKYMCKDGIDCDIRLCIISILRHVSALERYPSFYADVQLTVGLLSLFKLFFPTLNEDEESFNDLIQKFASWLCETDVTEKRACAIHLFSTIELILLGSVNRKSSSSFGDHYLKYENAVYGITSLSEDFYRDHLNHIIRVLLLCGYLYEEIFGKEPNDQNIAQFRALFFAALYHDAMVLTSKLYTSLTKMLEKIRESIPSKTLSPGLFTRPALITEELKENISHINELIEECIHERGVQRELISHCQYQINEFNHAILELHEFVRNYWHLTNSSPFLKQSAIAILLHDKDFSLSDGSPFIAFEEIPGAFLLLLADEMQDWDRSAEWPSIISSFNKVEFSSKKKKGKVPALRIDYRSEQQDSILFSFDGLCKKFQNFLKLKKQKAFTVCMNFTIDTRILKQIHKYATLTKQLVIPSVIDNKANYYVFWNKSLVREIIYIKTGNEIDFDKMSHFEISIDQNGPSLGCISETGNKWKVSILSNGETSIEELRKDHRLRDFMGNVKKAKIIHFGFEELKQRNSPHDRRKHIPK